MTYPAYTRIQLESKKLVELKAIALQLHAAPLSNKRVTGNWVEAILAAQPQQVKMAEVEQADDYLFHDDPQPVNLPEVGDSHFIGDYLLRCIQVGGEYVTVWDVLLNASLSMGEIRMGWDCLWSHTLTLATFATPQEAVVDLHESALEFANSNAPYDQNLEEECFSEYPDLANERENAMTKIIYHQTKPGTDCPDGIASAWVCHKAFLDADIEGCVHQGELPDVSGYDRLVIVDFSFSAQILEEWAKTKKVIVIDHHKTAMNDLSQLSDHVLQKFDMGECGATLAWKYFFPNEPIPSFLSYVKDRDLWNFDLPFSEEIHEAIASLKYQAYADIDKQKRTFAIFDMIADMSAEQLQTVFAPWGYQLLKPKRERIAELAVSASQQLLDGHKIIVVEVPEKEGRLISDLCSYLYRNNPESAFVVAYYYSESDINLSFRSDKKGSNFDVSAIAKSLGGGGHHNAAGALVQVLPW
jgi:hypothetical protein